MDWIGSPGYVRGFSGVSSLRAKTVSYSPHCCLPLAQLLMHSKGSVNAHQMHEWSELLLLMTDVLPVAICQSTVLLST